jgi:hypothetical protein
MLYERRALSYERRAMLYERRAMLYERRAIKNASLFAIHQTKSEAMIRKDSCI